MPSIYCAINSINLGIPFSELVQRRAPRVCGLQGWAAKGHPGYWGYAWYRTRVQLQEQPKEKLALSGPLNVDDVYQVFDKGELVGCFGEFTGGTPIVYYTRTNHDRRSLTTNL